jgi:hypothetical protein
LTIVYHPVTSLTIKGRKIKTKKTIETKIKEATMSYPTLNRAIFLTLLFLLPLIAQDNNVTDQIGSEDNLKIERAIANYKKALESDNAGVIESAILNTMNLKYTYPEEDYQALMKPLAQLETTAPTKSTRFLAYIVKNYLMHPERFAWIDKVCCEQDENFFAVISKKIHEQVDE